MIYDDNYNYKLISEDEFNTKYLLSKNDGSKYKKYMFIFYKDNNEIKNEELPNKDYLDKYNNVISTYEVEEIISSCIYFDSGFEYKKYYKIKNMFNFIKYKCDEDSSFLIGENDNEKVKELLENLKGE